MRALGAGGHVVGTQGSGSRAADVGTMVERALHSPNCPRETEAQRDKGRVQGQEADMAAQAAVPGFGTGLRDLQQAGQMRAVGERSGGAAGWRHRGAAWVDGVDRRGQAEGHSRWRHDPDGGTTRPRRAPDGRTFTTVCLR